MNVHECPNVDAESGYRPVTAAFVDGAEFYLRKPNDGPTEETHGRQ